MATEDVPLQGIIVCGLCEAWSISVLRLLTKPCTGQLKRRTELAHHQIVRWSGPALVVLGAALWPSAWCEHCPAHKLHRVVFPFILLREEARGRNALCGLGSVVEVASEILQAL